MVFCRGKGASYGLKECGIPYFKIHFTDLYGDIILSDMSLLLSVGLPGLQNFMDGDFVCQMWHAFASYKKMYPAPSLNIASESWISAAVWWIKTCGPTIPASEWNCLTDKWLKPVGWNIVQSVCLPHYADNKTEVSRMKHQLDATLCRFYFCRVTLHVSGASAHHQEYLKLVQRPLVHVL